MSTQNLIEGILQFEYKEGVQYLINSVNQLNFDVPKIEVPIYRHVLDNLLPLFLDTCPSIIFIIPDKKYTTGFIDENIIYMQGDFTGNEKLQNLITSVHFKLKQHEYTMLRLEGSKLEFIKQQYNRFLTFQKMLPDFPMYKSNYNIIDFCLSFKTDYQHNILKKNRGE